MFPLSLTQVVLLIQLVQFFFIGFLILKSDSKIPPESNNSLELEGERPNKNTELFHRQRHNKHHNKYRRNKQPKDVNKSVTFP